MRINMSKLSALVGGVLMAGSASAAIDGLIELPSAQISNGTLVAAAPTEITFNFKLSEPTTVTGTFQKVSGFNKPSHLVPEAIVGAVTLTASKAIQGFAYDYDNNWLNGPTPADANADLDACYVNTESQWACATATSNYFATNGAETSEQVFIRVRSVSNGNKVEGTYEGGVNFTVYTL